MKNLSENLRVLEVLAAVSPEGLNKEAEEQLGEMKQHYIGEVYKNLTEEPAAVEAVPSLGEKPPHGGSF